MLTSHDPDQDAITATRRSLLRRKALAGVYRSVDGIIAMSDSARDELVSAFDVPASKVARIAHGNYRSYGADCAPSKPVARQRLGLTAEGKLVLFFGSLKPSKGLECLLRAFARVREAEPTARLLVAGEPRGVEVPALEALAERLHLGESAMLRPGYVPSEAVPDYLAAADLVALPYLRIFQSGVLHLAYSFGRPVVATRVGALAEDVQDGKSGLLVPPGDEEALADAILELLGSPERLATMGAYAMELSQTVYDWKAIARQTLDFYESLLTRGRAT